MQLDVASPYGNFCFWFLLCALICSFLLVSRTFLPHLLIRQMSIWRKRRKQIVWTMCGKFDFIVLSQIRPHRFVKFYTLQLSVKFPFNCLWHWKNLYYYFVSHALSMVTVCSSVTNKYWLKCTLELRNRYMWLRRQTNEFNWLNSMTTHLKSCDWITQCLALSMVTVPSSVF